jgi:hypothetical protein
VEQDPQEGPIGGGNPADPNSELGPALKLTVRLSLVGGLDL